MKRLYVLYDGECGLCQRCRQWIQAQPAYIELRFIPLQSPEVGCRFPGIESIDLRARLVVISDTGGLYQGQNAWIMCLFALEEYREWAQRLAEPELLPYAKLVCESVSKNRYSISKLLRLSTDKLSRRLSDLQYTR